MGTHHVQYLTLDKRPQAPTPTPTPTGQSETKQRRRSSRLQRDSECDPLKRFPEGESRACFDGDEPPLDRLTMTDASER